MSESIFWAGLIVGTLIFWAVRSFGRAELRSEVERLMSTDGDYPANVRLAVTRARALLAIRGHRLDRRTRDALTVWLAEQGDS